MTDPSIPAVIEMVDVELASYFMAPVSEPKLTNPEEVQEAIRGLKVSKAPGPNGIPNRALKHLPQRAVTLLVLIFNALLLTHHFPTAWKHARVISLMKPEEVQEAVRSLKASKASGQNGTPNRFLKHLPQRAVTFLVPIFNAILLNHYYPTAWKHTRVISILKPAKDPTLP